MERTTEADSRYDGLEHMSTADLLSNINREDHTVATAVQKEIPRIERLVDAVVEKMKLGGRLFYIGAGTSGRLGVVDASECPPTFGIEFDRVIGIIAGGDTAIRKAVEFAEDDLDQAWKDLNEWKINSNDVVVGIAASGTTPYVIGGVSDAKKAGCITGCITCNAGSPLAGLVDFPIEAVSGPEFVTGSTRMKAGTAQKLVLNMLSTAVMIRLGRVKGNKMVDMQLTNNKLVDRGTRMIMKAVGKSEEESRSLLLQHGSVRKAIDAVLQS
ncbi:MAG TPA: N-acetylmuramic acid 6-phosphate etherase [Flavobacteriales bacterium]|nr:N-acetylmuramic acid 6-phosphate etherase [Flavobacteriales bacterium]HPH82335.1 N-acetylmuramic acid 6-phosphate etherase [Flavobacteriales bacterium]